MVISELIARLQAIAGVHGDVLVLHHDDWDDFCIESVTYYPALKTSGSVSPAHVVLTGESVLIDAETGQLRNLSTQKETA